MGFTKPPRCRDAGGLLHHRFSFSLYAEPRRWESSFLRHFPSGRPAWPLASMLPCGARTFLTRAQSVLARPSGPLRREIVAQSGPHRLMPGAPAAHRAVSREASHRRRTALWAAGAPGISLVSRASIGVEGYCAGYRQVEPRGFELWLVRTEGMRGFLGSLSWLNDASSYALFLSRVFMGGTMR